MKGQISRYSHRHRPPGAGYSGVYLQQGRMVTDADQIESTEIHKGRVDALGAVAVASGVPVEGGAVAFDGATPLLQPGRVVVEGIHGLVRAAAGFDAGAAGPLALYANQADFPAAPPLEGPALVYLDLWEQPVYPPMDPQLVDPALHGADTAFRTRTVAQLRLAPPGSVLGTGAFPPHGTAALDARLREALAEEDKCDPCATELDLPVRAGNMQFRLEVLDVVGPADDPSEVVFAWSAENASELYPTDLDSIPPEFRRGDRIYQYLSPITEAHQGAFADTDRRARPQLSDELLAATPARTDGTAGAWPLVRRWDGAVTWTPADGNLGLANAAGGETVERDGDDLLFVLDKLELRLTVAGRSFLPGDYWFVTVREFAPEAERVQVDSALPLGIRHHYLPLFEIDAGEAAQPVDDAIFRRLSFPPLSDLPASHVSYANTCPKLYGEGEDGAKTVQEALDKLCAIEARDIAFTSNCPEVFGDAATVQAALDRICDLDFTAEIFRYLVGCGILCGFEVRCIKESPGSFLVLPGAFHDGTGRVFRLRERIELKVRDLIEGDPRGNEFCLRARVTGPDDFIFELVPHRRAEEEGEKGRREDALSRIKACEAIGKVREEVLKGFAKEEQDYIARAFAFALAGTSPGKPFPQSAQEHDILRRYYTQVLARLEIVASCGILQKLGPFPKLPRNPGRVQLQRNMGNVVVALRALEEAVRAAERDCKCAATVVPCPEDEPCLVDIARITLGDDGVDDICLQCCRDEALTFRTVEYWFGSFLTELQTFMARQLCAVVEPAMPPKPEEKPGGSIVVEDGIPTWDKRRFVEKYGITNATFGPSAYRHDAVDARDLTTDEALSLYEAAGVEVVGDFDLARDDFETLPLAEDELSANLAFAYGDTVQPGDRIVLLTRDGKVEGARLVAKQAVDARLAPPTKLAETGLGGARAGIPEELLADLVERSVADKMPEVTADFSGLEEKAEALSRKREELEAEIGGLEAKRAEAMEATRTGLSDLERQKADALAVMRSEIEAMQRTRADLVSGLRSEVESLERRRSEIGAAVEAAGGELQRMTRDVADAKREAEEARRAAERAKAESEAAGRELAEVKLASEKALGELRDRQPVSVLTNRPEVASALNERGIGTLAEVADMNANSWRALGRSLGLSVRETTDLRNRARTLTGRR